MKFSRFLFILQCTILAVLVSSTPSCTSYALFQTENKPTQNIEQFISKTPPTILQEGDKITVSVWNHDDLSVGSVNEVFSANESTGRWVEIDERGEVNLPRLGRVKLKGLTPTEANYRLETLLKEFIKDPIVNVKVLNHYVDVLGEVKMPGRVRLDSKETSLLDAIAQVQGLTENAKSTKVQLLRQQGNEISELQIDLTSMESLKLYNISLKPGDVIYVPPSEKKSRNEVIEKVAPIASVVTAVAVLASIFINK